MQTLNYFMLHINKRLENVEFTKRNRIIRKAIKDLEDTEIFTPLYEYDDELDSVTFDEESGIDESLVYQFQPQPVDRTSIYELDSREDNILKWQQYYNPEDDVKEQQPIKSDRRRGNTDLHEAVAIGDTEMIYTLLDQGENPHEKNDSGQTPIYLAIVENNQMILNIFREKNYINTQ